MQIDKDTIVNFLRQQGNQQQADQANQELPQQVDTDEHGGLLAKYGIDIKKLMSAVAGGEFGGLGKLL